MFTHASPHSRGISAAAVATATLTVFLLAGCSGATGTPTATSSADPASAGIAGKVAAESAAIDTYPIPTDAVDPAAAEGETVYYIPITLQSPQFSITAAALTDGLDAVGAKLQVCDGGANPSTINACVGQATEAGAGAIILDAIPYALASNSLDAAQAAGIPVLITDQITDPSNPVGPTYAEILAPVDQMVPLADWIIADSAGSATVVVNQSVDGPAPAAYAAAAQAEFDAECPDCTIAINEVSSSNFGLVPSSTSAALLKNPNANYLLVQFDQYLQPSLGGAQQASRTDLKGLTGSGTLGSLQMLADGNFLHAVEAQAVTFQGWLLADAAIRLMSGVGGDDLPAYEIPSRLFTRDNVGEIELTEDAQNSGAWFGATDFPDDFKTLWGVN